MSLQPEIGALSPLIFGADRATLQRHFYGEFQSFAGITYKKWFGRKKSLKDDINYVDMITAACMMIPKQIFDQLRGFDENFFMYCEDDDLCRRIISLGLKNAVYNQAKIIHLEGKSSSSEEKKKMYYRSQDYYWQKHYGRARMLLMKMVRWPYKTLKSLR